ncbi:MAG: hypothetical protein ACI4EY_12330 [Lachnospiraceae bacterium]
MNMKKGIVGLMAVAGIGLAGAVVALNSVVDDKPPVIHFQDDIEVTYTEGDPYDVFLEGVTAEDNQDGDVTDSVVVESVYPTKNGDSAMVIYVARDSKNNVTKISRWVKGNIIKETKADKAETDEKDQLNDLHAAMDAVQAQNETQEQTDDVSPESPKITLTTDNVTIQAGEEIQRLSYVENITDDKDDAASLWQNINIIGDEFDNNTPGVYEQIYYVVDSDGNKSNEATLTITVKGD